MSESLRLDAREKAALEETGFVLRRDVFAPSECRAIADACEALVDRLLAEQRRTKHTVGSYMFELQRRLETIVKWEPGAPDLLQGVEPFAHLNDDLYRWAHDPRFVEPCKDLVQQDDVILFTEKLNVKRAHKGGPIVLHQDFPYWCDITEAAPRVATAMVFLDDATKENGCLEVVPGSHREGLQERRPIEGFGSFEIDTQKYDQTRLVALEVAAGSVVFFGPFLVHRSLPNLSGADRRALLYSYQPAGYQHMRDLTWRQSRPQENP